MTESQIIEQALDIFVECVKFSVEEKLEDPFITLRMNVLGVIYGATMPKHEINQENVKQCWKQIIEQFGIYHMLGQNKRVVDGSRDLTDEEQRLLEV